jgi:hypothetical protein
MRVILAAGVVLALAVVGVAQERPDFSGRWVVVGTGQGAGRVQIVTHDAKTLVTEYPDNPARRTVVQLDGNEHRGTIASRVGEIVTMTRAVWEERRLVIAIGTNYPNGMKTSAREVWSIDAEGRLVIDYTEAGPRGEAGPKTQIVMKKAG